MGGIETWLAGAVDDRIKVAVPAIAVQSFRWSLENDRWQGRARTIAEFTQLRHRWFTPHTWTNGLGLLANLHVAAGVGGGPYVEFPYDPPGWTERRRDFFLTEPLLVDSGGYLTVPGRPGLGVAIDESAVSRWALP